MLTLFYHPEISSATLTLSLEESRHCVKALRHRAGDEIAVTDGSGTIARGVIVVASPTECVVQITARHEQPARRWQLHLAVAPTKNADRIEWLVEKAVEIGVEKITFLCCDHSERTKIDLDRLHRIAVAALKQSQTALLPPMQLLPFTDFLAQCQHETAAKYIAWCDDDNTQQLVNEEITTNNVLLLIGPEGDFSQEEITACRAANFKEIKLGNRRLRTETAALYGCCAIAALNAKFQ